MWSLEEIASNKPLTKEESAEWLNPNYKQRPTCACLREHETGEPSQINCFVQCDEQHEILSAREKLKKQI